MKYSRSVFLRAFILFWTPAIFDTGLSLGEEPATRGPAADIDAQKQVEFRRDVLPLLRRNCLACHSQSEAESELVMETAESILAGGDSGPAIIPGQADESLLFQLASHRTEPFMPPVDNDVGAKPLQPEQLALLKRWIDQGARAGESEQVEQIAWKTVPAHYAPIYALDVSSDGKLVVAGRGNQIVLYNVGGKRELQRLTDPNLKSSDGTPSGIAHLDIVQSLAFSRDGQLLASGGFRCVKIWRRPPITRGHQVQLPEPPRVAISSPDGTLLALCFRGLIELRDARGILVAELGVDGGDIVAADFLDADQLATVAEAGEVQIRSTADLTVLHRWPVPDGTGEVHALAVLQAGSIIAVASRDGVVHIWRRSDGGEFLPRGERQIRVGEPGQLRQVLAVPADEPLLAVAGSDGTVRFWHGLDGQQRGEIQAGGELTSLAASRDGQRLVTLLADGSGKLWNVQNRQLIKELPRDVFSRADVASATRLVGLRKERHRVAVADLEEAKKRQSESDKSLKSGQEELKKAEEEVPKKQETLDKAKLLANQREEAVEKLAQSTADFKKQIAEIDRSLGEIKDAADDAQRKALQQKREQLKQGIKNSENELKTAKQELDKLRGQQRKDELAVEMAQKAVVTARAAIERAEKFVQQAADAQAEAEKEAESFAEKVKSSETEFEQVTERASGSWSHFVQAMFSRDGWRLLVQDKQGRLTVVTAETGEPLDGLDGPQPGMMMSAGKGRVCLLDEQTLTSWHIDQPWTLAKVLGDPADDSIFVDRVTALAFSDDGTWLATGGGEPSRSGEVQLWKVADWQCAASIRDAHSDVVYDLGFSPQGKYLASCGSDRMMKLIDVGKAQLWKQFEGHTGHVLGVAWRADGRTLATAGADRVVKVWDAKSGTQRKSLTGFKKEITGIRYLGLEDRFVFAMGDGQVMSRNSNGDGRPAFPGFSDYVHRISTSLDGSLVAAAGQDGVVRLWDSQGKKLAEFGK